MSQALAHLVDDDEAIRDALAWLLKSRGLPSVGYPSAEDFLDQWTPEMAGCIVLDMRMGGMTGLDCFDRLVERNSTLPVIFLTGHGDVPMAVGALKKGAFDFFEKASSMTTTWPTRIERSNGAGTPGKGSPAATAVDSVKTVRASRSLTTRERQIMELVLAGKFNKVIADELNISMRTVEVHRANLFDKMHVKTAVELANLLKSGG